MKLIYLPNSSSGILSTQGTIDDLKSSGTDFEWYPTTDKMIDTVVADACSAHRHGQARSIIDIGAGDGRVLAAFKQSADFDLTDYFGIEKSPNHVSRWPSEYTFLGGDFYESDISGNKVDITFSNPPYSDYERWTDQLIRRNYSTVIYLVLPSRWKNSKRITLALEHRDLVAEVILSDDFSTADRKARATVDVVRIVSKRNAENVFRNSLTDDGEIGKGASPYSFRCERGSDPMDIWFDEMFPNIAGMKEPEKTSCEAQENKAYGLFKKTNTIDDLLMLYQIETDKVLKNYKAFDGMDMDFFSELNIDLDTIKKILKTRMNSLQNEFWNAFIHNYEPITSRLTKKYQAKIYENLISKSKNISFNATNALIVTQMVINMGNEYADDQVTDFFYALSNPKYVTLYKSNQKVFQRGDWRFNKDPSDRANRYTLDYRIIQPCLFGLRLNIVDRFEGYEVNKVVNDICVVARLIGMKLPPECDGRDFVSKDVCAGERLAVNYSEFGSGEETELFAIKFFANQNQHIYLSKEFAMRLNIYVGRLLGWVTSADEAFEEMKMKNVSKEFFGDVFNDTKPKPIEFSDCKISGYLSAI